MTFDYTNIGSGAGSSMRPAWWKENIGVMELGPAYRPAPATTYESGRTINVNGTTIPVGQLFSKLGGGFNTSGKGAGNPNQESGYKAQGYQQMMGYLSNAANLQGGVNFQNALAPYANPIYPADAKNDAQTLQQQYTGYQQQGVIKPLWAQQSASNNSPTMTNSMNSTQSTADSWWAANNPAAIAPKGIGQGSMQSATGRVEDPYSQTIRDIRAQYAARGMSGSQEELNDLAKAELEYQKQYKNVTSAGGTSTKDAVADALNETIRLIRERFAGLGRSGSAEEYQAIQDAAISAVSNRTATSSEAFLPLYANKTTGVLGAYPENGFNYSKNPYGRFS